MRRISLVSVRLVRERGLPYERRSIETSRDIYDCFRTVAEDLDREAFWIVCLDTKNRVNSLSQVALGSLNAAIIHPREVYKAALLANAAAVIAIHNHPSGDPNPSREDQSLTRKLQEVGTVLGIKLLDHLIIGDGTYYSFADSGGL